MPTSLRVASCWQAWPAQPGPKSPLREVIHQTAHAGVDGQNPKACSRQTDGRCPAAEAARLLALHGFKHDVIPHVNRVFEVLGKKSGALDAKVSVDIEALMPERLAAYDVLVLNNNCSVGSRRNLFLDELERNPKYRGMTKTERQRKAKHGWAIDTRFCGGRKGLVVIHGAPTMLNNSAKFTEMVGGAFYYHPPNQEVTVRTVDADHPLLAAFRGKGRSSTATSRIASTVPTKS